MTHLKTRGKFEPETGRWARGHLSQSRLGIDTDLVMQRTEMTHGSVDKTLERPGMIVDGQGDRLNEDKKK